MKLKTIITSLLVGMLAMPLMAQPAYNKLIAMERDSINTAFADTATSILLPEDLVNFSGLNYFPIDVKWKIAAKFKRKRFTRKFKMQTSTDRLPVYKKYGVLRFEVDGKKVKMAVYQNIGLSKKEGFEDYLFCPFRDLTAPDESYGGGRYIDLRKKDLSKKCTIDFNTSYNPYCAYNYKYSCPIPPKENHLNVRIEAGIKKWH
jgi:uncharacterized protein (DUF1684 family)